MSFRLSTVAAIAAITLASCASPPVPSGKRELMIVANDKKQSWDATGRLF
jgi:hypothetical protein